MELSVAVLKAPEDTFFLGFYSDVGKGPRANGDKMQEWGGDRVCRADESGNEQGRVKEVV